VEPEILVFDQSKKDQKIRDLEIAITQNKNLEEKVEEQGKQINSLTREIEKVKQWREISIKYQK
jgi:predicted RNase H-like nuclease (RuvC/YqgF family)